MKELNFKEKGNIEDFENWKKNNPWVYNYAVFLTLKKQNELRMWSEWPIEQQNWIVDHKYKIGRLKGKIEYEMWTQYILFTQWAKFSSILFSTKDEIEEITETCKKYNVEVILLTENQY